MRLQPNVKIILWCQRDPGVTVRQSFGFCGLQAFVDLLIGFVIVWLPFLLLFGVLFGYYSVGSARSRSKKPHHQPHRVLLNRNIVVL